MNNLPQVVKSVLWSYDTNRIDLEVHRKTIISQVLNLGSYDATRWLFLQYGKELVTQVAQTVPSGQWNKKSLNYWSLVLGIKPKLKSEVVL